MKECYDTNDKCYQITLTEEQFRLVCKALEIMMTTGNGNMALFAEWLACGDLNYLTDEHELFDIRFIERNLICGLLSEIMKELPELPSSKLSDTQELKTLVTAFHYMIAHCSIDNEEQPDDTDKAQFGSLPIPRIKIVPMEHAHWILSNKDPVRLIGLDSFKCSNCGRFLKREKINNGLGDGQYCPYCGAKMDGGVRNE